MLFTTKDGENFDDYNKALQHEAELDAIAEEHQKLESIKGLLEHIKVRKVNFGNSFTAYCVVILDDYLDWMIESLIGKTYRYNRQSDSLVRRFTTSDLTSADSEDLGLVAKALANAQLENGGTVDYQFDNNRFFFFTDRATKLPNEVIKPKSTMSEELLRYLFG